ncbi:MAG: ATPase [Propionibacterium sp.]|nr:ATPase [Propionibacterium sp.]
MPVTAVTTDPLAHSLTLTADYAAPPERVWRAFTDPRQLERFWGPPGWPARFGRFELEVGGRAVYTMHGPSGDQSSGTWEFITIRPHEQLEMTDAFSDAEGTVDAAMPVSRIRITFSPGGAGTTVKVLTEFDSLEALEQVVGMGAIEGSTMAFNQLDAVLQGIRAYAQGRGTQAEPLGDRYLRITRLVEAPMERVWRAHTEPEQMRRWLLGPDGWRMTACEMDLYPGGRYRYAWEPEEGVEGEAFGFDGETLLLDVPRRLVTTEHMTGTEFPSTVNDLGLIEEDGATLITTLIEYPDAETRETVLATGMTDGMEASYARLERGLAGE